MPRHLTPYERTHLLRYGFNPENIESFGEMPVEYITQRVSFLSREFQVNQLVLIPRVETEELVHRVLDRLKLRQLTNSEPFRLADIGTGSGAIGISLFLELRQRNIPAQFFLSDNSAEALVVAKQNVTTLVQGNSSTEDVILLQSDLLQNYPAVFFDVIVANLPYIPQAQLATLAPSVKDFEPTSALDGGLDGLTLIRQLVVQAPRFLKPSGEVWLEIDESHSVSQLQTLAPQFIVVLHPDSFGKSRFAQLTLR